MQLRAAAVLAGVLLLAGLAVVLVPRGGGEDVAAPAATPTPTPTASPTPTPTPTVPPAEPFDVTLEHVWGHWLGNEIIFGDDSPEPDPAVLEQAATEATAALSAFLDAMFVDEQTRFSPAAVELLLDDVGLAAVTEGEHAGLGVVAVGDLAGTETGAASARATVLVGEDGPQLVWLDYVARTTVVLEDGADLAITQSGNLVMMPTEDGWRARTADVTTTAEDA